VRTLGNVLRGSTESASQNKPQVSFLGSVAERLDFRSATRLLPRDAAQPENRTNNDAAIGRSLTGMALAEVPLV